MSVTVFHKFHGHKIDKVIDELMALATHHHLEVNTMNEDLGKFPNIDIEDNRLNVAVKNSVILRFWIG
jgi:hypothetical protein